MKHPAGEVEFRNLIVDLTNAALLGRESDEALLFAKLEKLILARIANEGVSSTLLETWADYTPNSAVAQALYLIAIAMGEHANEKQSDRLLCFALMIETSDPKLCRRLLKKIDANALSKNDVQLYKAALQRQSLIKKNP